MYTRVPLFFYFVVFHRTQHTNRCLWPLGLVRDVEGWNLSNVSSYGMLRVGIFPIQVSYGMLRVESFQCQCVNYKNTNRYMFMKRELEMYMGNVQGTGRRESSSAGFMSSSSSSMFRRFFPHVAVHRQTSPAGRMTSCHFSSVSPYILHSTYN